MLKYFVIFNPAARGEKSQRLLAFLRAREGRELTLAPTRSAGDAQRLAAEGIASGHNVIVAAGGDGTVNEVVNGIGSANVALGVLPLGTVNVLAREFRIPLQIEAAWKVIETGAERTIDLPVAEFGGLHRSFIQLAGVGFDAAVVRAASWELKKRVGPFSYVLAGLQALHRQHPEIEVVSDTGERLRGVAVFVGNGRFYGGPFPLFPAAELHDGLLDVCVFESTRYWDLLRYGWGILRGTHLRQRGVGYLQARGFHCAPVGDVPVPFELDGEDVGLAPVRFALQPRALRVIVPAAR